MVFSFSVLGSRYTVLPWEDEDEYRVLVDVLVMEHAPSGPTEEHLVEELAGILWRKRRLRMAETATYHHWLVNALDSDEHTVGAAPAHLDAKNPAQREAAAALHASPDATPRDLPAPEGHHGTPPRALQMRLPRRPAAYDQRLSACRRAASSWRRMPQPGPSCASHPRLRTRSVATAGPETCASSRTRCSGSRRSPRARN